ncbi:hypothetical protein IAG25_39555 [Caballeronia sp. EK]|uniref:hypothetical protein n=1 Tax=Caballeronia sp. EK TaxID=2767469 RepID=UPI001654E324|nr:hypothetical protein [Caballeronia sp. EK]MBC8642882.1 hypothetical protein [Caballeronia sp. EK]
MKFAVTVVSPPGYVHSAAFHEVAETLHYALLALGHDSVMTREGRLDGRRHIVLGSNLLPHYPLTLAPDAILYNLEQVHAGSPWITPPFLALLRRHAVWDYDAANARASRPSACASCRSDTCRNSRASVSPSRAISTCCSSARCARGARESSSACVPRASASSPRSACTAAPARRGGRSIVSPATQALFDRVVWPNSTPCPPSDLHIRAERI